MSPAFSNVPPRERESLLADLPRSLLTRKRLIPGGRDCDPAASNFDAINVDGNPPISPWFRLCGVRGRNRLGSLPTLGSYDWPTQAPVGAALQFEASITRLLLVTGQPRPPSPVHSLHLRARCAPRPTRQPSPLECDALFHAKRHRGVEQRAPSFVCWRVTCSGVGGRTRRPTLVLPSDRLPTSPRPPPLGHGGGDRVPHPAVRARTDSSADLRRRSRPLASMH
jgi:hypothetical protein